MDEKLSIIIVEWDGGRPPTTWYNRLQKLGLKIQGNKDQSPIERRTSQKMGGVVMQEGAIVVNTQSMARTLGHLAYTLGAKNVSVGYVDFSVLEMTEGDAQAMNRIQQTLGRRGRPGEERPYVVTCIDEMHSYQTVGQEPVNCPHCGSFKIQYRPGDQKTYLDDGSLGLVDLWKGSRFGCGVWETSHISTETGEAVTEPNMIPHDTENAARLENSTLYQQVTDWLGCGKIDRNQALEILDQGWGVLMYTDKDNRQKARLEGLNLYFKRGGSPLGIDLMVDRFNVDAFDLMGTKGGYRFVNMVLG